MHHERMKHVAVKYHFVRDLISMGEVQVLKIATANNAADKFTKVLPMFTSKEALRMLLVTNN